MNMKKDPETSFNEMMARNERSQLHQSAFTFWKESNYDRKDHYDRFKKFCRWFDPSWTLPDHVQPIADLFSKNFSSHKVIVTNRGEGVRMHFNPSRVQSNNYVNWKEWQTWSYSICIPFDVNDFEPTIMVYGDYISNPEELRYNPIVDIDVSKLKTITCEPFSRVSFPSSRYPHGVCSSDNRIFWILNDMQYLGEPPHVEIDNRIITDLSELDKDMNRVINMKKPNGENYLKQQFMADLDYFLSFNKPPTELDWMPEGL